MDIVFWAGLLAATLSAGLAVFGLTHQFKEDDGSLTRSGKIALYGTTVVGLLTVGLFAWQSEASRRAAAVQAAEDRVVLELLQLAALPPVDAFSAVIEYQPDAYLDQMHAAYWEHLDECGDPPFSRDYIDTNIFARITSSDEGVGKYRIPGVCNRIETGGAEPNWSFLNLWVDYLGVPQFEVFLYEAGANIDDKPLASFEFQPWKQNWHSLDAYYGFDTKTELSNVVIRRAPVASEGTSSVTLQSLVGGFVVLDLNGSLGDDPEGFPEGMARAADQNRDVNFFALHLFSGALIELAEPTVLEREDDTIRLRFEFPKTTEGLIAALQAG